MTTFSSKAFTKVLVFKFSDKFLVFLITYFSADFYGLSVGIFLFGVGDNACHSSPQ